MKLPGFRPTAVLGSNVSPVPVYHVPFNTTA